MPIPPNFRLATRLIKMKTDDGFCEMKGEKTKIGDIYHLDPASKRLQRFSNIANHNEIFDIEIIDVWDENEERISILPVELFDI